MNKSFSTTEMIKKLNQNDGRKSSLFSMGLIGSQKEFVKKYISVNQINKVLSYTMLAVGLIGVSVLTGLIWNNQASLLTLLGLPVVYAVCESIVFRINLKRIDHTKEFQIAYINHHLKEYFGKRWEQLGILCDYDKDNQPNAEFYGALMLERVAFFTQYFCANPSRDFLSVLTSLVDHTVGMVGIRKNLNQETLNKMFPQDFNYHTYNDVLKECYQLREKVAQWDERWIKKFQQEFPLITQPDETLGYFENLDAVKQHYQEAENKYKQMQPVIVKLGETYADSSVIEVISLEDEYAAEKYTQKRDNDLSVDRLWNHHNPLEEVEKYYQHAPEMLKTRHLRG